MTSKEQIELTSQDGIAFTAFCAITSAAGGDSTTPGIGQECEVLRVVAHDAAQQQELEEEIAREELDVSEMVLDQLDRDGYGPDPDWDYEDRREAGC